VGPIGRLAKWRCTAYASRSERWPRAAVAGTQQNGCAARARQRPFSL